MSEQSLLQQAIAAVRAGRKAEARRLLAQILQADPRHEGAWLWMSAVVETDAKRAECLQKVLAINSDNAVARQGLVHLEANIGDTPVLPRSVIQTAVNPCPQCGFDNPMEAQCCRKCGQEFGLATSSRPQSAIACKDDNLLPGRASRQVDTTQVDHVPPQNGNLLEKQVNLQSMVHHEEKEPVGDVKAFLQYYAGLEKHNIVPLVHSKSCSMWHPKGEGPGIPGFKGTKGELLLWSKYLVFLAVHSQLVEGFTPII